MSLKNKLANLRNTPSPQVIFTADDQPDQRLKPTHNSSSSLANFFNKSRTASNSSLNHMLSNEYKSNVANNTSKNKKSDKLELLQYNKGSFLSPKMSHSSSNSSTSSKSKHFFSKLQQQNDHNSEVPHTSSKLELKRFFKNVINPSSASRKDHQSLGHQLKENVKSKHKQIHSHHHHLGHHWSGNRDSKRHSDLKMGENSAAQAPQLVQTPQDKMFFGAETSLELIRKYGVPGKVLGEGAGGSVAIVERPSDGRIFAVKQFRAKTPKESDYDYKKKVQSEFFVGSTLHHQNVIETMDMLQEGLKFLIVMEYCPYDFFTIVMSGLLQKNEIACYFKQIVHGVSYLHSMGLAHRDLKLDNCVVTQDGILKLIDFGSAVVFKYPFEEETIKAKGIVGSDPYLAPEVLTLTQYDPRPVDVWSIAIIFCCMTLRRFPWKVPKLSDPSYKLFALVPSSSSTTLNNSASTLDLDHLKHDELSTKELHELQMKTNMIANKTTVLFAPRSKSKGPYRLLRLLPHSSRPLIGAMLELDASKRISIERVLQDEWFESIQVCEVEGEQCVKAGNHTHHLVTEDQLNKIQEERERLKKLKEEAGLGLDQGLNLDEGLGLNLDEGLGLNLDQGPSLAVPGTTVAVEQPVV